MHQTMVAACEEMKLADWKHLRPMVAAELQSLILMIKWLKEMQQEQQINVSEARIHLEIQKSTLRTRLMALPQLSILQVDELLNKAIDAVRKDIYEYLGWVVM